mgnify:FL=1|tara:strand:+ start:516 stop:1685 length:1170 start_codon:yes stop_codon:yes gene_type:complete
MIKSKKININVVTGTRAEFGLLKKLIKEINNDDEFNLSLSVTGSHLSSIHGETINEIINEGLQIDFKVDLKLKFDTPKAISEATANGIKGFAKIFSKSKPDLLIILGDRYEILSAVLAACFENIPIAHIHGGERTEGLIDESIRHAITKFSHLHFVASETYRNRVIQLGENPKNVFNVGGLGVDALNQLKLFNKLEIEKKLNIKLIKKNLLITYHPETLDNKLSIIGISELLKSLNKIKDTTLIFTLPNADPNNRIIIEKINIFVKKKSFAYAFSSLGQLNYFSLLKYCDGVVGNSSSGLLEVPSFKKATINIGNRQMGRLKAKSVIDCEPDEKQIFESIKRIYSEDFQNNLKNTKSPYGKPGAPNRIIDIIKKTELKNLIKKSFYDLN